MPVGIGIWLLLLGYAVSWAGWQNLGVDYAPQQDGTVKPSRPKVTLLDAFTCRSSSASSSAPVPVTPAMPGTSPSGPQAAPNPNPQGAPSWQILAPIATPAPLPTPRPGFPRPPGRPQPLPGPLGGIFTNIGRGLQSLWTPLRRGLAP